jgi:tetraacyldisaccharide 4'-kinase
MLKLIFAPLSLIYGFVIWIRNFLFDKQIFKTNNFNVPVISIGNLTMGGTGKTPTVQYLTELLTEIGYKPGVVSRGYGRKTKGTVIVNNGLDTISTPELAGDEPVLLSNHLQNIPIIVDENRANGIDEMINQFLVNVILLDDAFQHRSVHRDLDIVLLDATEDKENYKLLPLGRLREPISNIKRADIVIHTRVQGDAGPKTTDVIRKHTNSPQLQSKFAPSILKYYYDIGFQKEKKTHHTVFAFCGIGNPESFYRFVDNSDIDCGGKYSFKDHQEYNIKTVEFLKNKMVENNCDALLTTEKDIIKLPQELLKTTPVYVIKIQLEMNEDQIQILKQHIKTLFKSSKSKSIE